MVSAPAYRKLGPGFDFHPAPWDSSLNYTALRIMGEEVLRITLHFQYVVTLIEYTSFFVSGIFSRFIFSNTEDIV